jgi:hypothetical protein
MYRSRTISVSIHCPVKQVYEFLAEPLNLPTWAASFTGKIEHLRGNDWLADIEGNPVVVRYFPRNDLGILDHSVFPEGTEPFTTPMRVVANDVDGTELLYVHYQRPGMSDEIYGSEGEWILADLMALKALLEAGSGR